MATTTNTTTDKMNPNVHTSMDGHFWVVRDGKIIDPEFPEYAKTRYIFDCTKERVYLPAPEPTQSLIINMYKRHLMKLIGTDNWDAAVQVYHRLCIMNGHIKPEADCCYQNALFELYNGGELVFGSFGWKRTNGEVHYEYGGNNYVTLNDFVNGIPTTYDEASMRRAIEFISGEAKMKKCRRKRN